MAGCPNIQGRTGTWLTLQDYEGGGAIYKNIWRSDGYGFGGWGSNLYSEILFSAQKSNSIYGSSSTVTPLSESVIMCISY